MNNSRLSNLAKDVRCYIYASWIAPLLLVLALPTAVNAQFTYITNNGAITITGYTGAGGAVSIPGIIDGLPVTIISAGAFNQCTSLTSATIPNSVTNIGGGAFQYCTSLASIALTDGLISIGDMAFLQCTNLANVKIPNSVSRLGWDAFASCTRLTNVTIGNTVASIDCAFWSCTRLTKVIIGNGVTNIGYGSFQGCGSLARVTLPSRVINIGDAAFDSCTNLTGVYFLGNAPRFPAWGLLGNAHTTVYFLAGTTGWGPTYGGRPTALWPAPTIQTPPQTQTAEVGSAAEFGVQAMSPGDLVLGYQWFLNGTTRLTCTNSVLQLAGVQYSQAGAYTVVVTNAARSVTSPPALLSVIAPVEQRMVPTLTLLGQPGTTLNLDFTAALRPGPLWTTFDHVPLTAASQWYFDLSAPLPPQGFYRAWQSSGGTPPALDLHFVPALTLGGAIGSSLRIDYINQFGPIDAWVTLATVTLTNTTQLYFDTSAIGQPPRLWRLVPMP